jgi:excisionase family DNA binding protein
MMNCAVADSDGRLVRDPIDDEREWLVRSVGSGLVRYHQSRRWRPALTMSIRVAPGRQTSPASAYLTLEELAAYANLSVRTLRKFLSLPSDQALPAYRPGRRLLVRREEFDLWFQRFRTRGRPALVRNLRALGFDAERLDEAGSCQS